MYIWRGAMIGMMLLCNAMMLTYFVGALKDSNSLSATALSTASNFIVTVILNCKYYY